MKVLKDNACKVLCALKVFSINFIVVDILRLRGYHLLAIQILLWVRVPGVGGDVYRSLEHNQIILSSQPVPLTLTVSFLNLLKQALSTIKWVITSYDCIRNKKDLWQCWVCAQVNESYCLYLSIIESVTLYFTYSVLNIVSST